MLPDYHSALAKNRLAYDGNAEDRDREVKSPWKLAERARFLEQLRDAGAARLLEVGAGTGQDSLFFQEHGLDVTATDASASMVSRCRSKGLRAEQQDLLSLSFEPAAFDAVYAMNCLLHVPNVDLPEVLASIRSLLAPRGLLFVGVYGGEDTEGELEADPCTPRRFFSLRTDQTLLGLLSARFDVLDFHVVPLDPHRFQSATLRPRD